MDAWLGAGHLVVSSSERAARALTGAFHRARQAEGLKAWTSPKIYDWNSFVRWAWTARSLDGRLLLNRTQEQAVWAEIALADGRLRTLLEGPRFRLAAQAMEAHELLCSHAPRYLRASARAAWQQDAAAFGGWLLAFDESCRAGNMVSAARLPMELLSLLDNPGDAGDDRSSRPPILLAGFDRMLPVQRAVFDAWGSWQEAELGKPAGQVEFHQAAHERAELDACAIWCARELVARPRSRILVVTQDVPTRRGEIERAFLEHAGTVGSLPYEFSLGVPLIRMTLPRAALLLLRWLCGPLDEHEIDWLLSTGYAAASPHETDALLAHMHAIRRRGLQQPDWTLSQFLRPFSKSTDDRSELRAWSHRLNSAKRELEDFGRRPQSPLEWAELVPRLLESLLFASSRAQSSAEFQSLQRWQQALESAGSLGFDGRRIDWKDFLSVLARTLDETLFAPESRDAPILIAGPAESAGLTADAVWFLGATEDAWPARGATHALLPLEVQREAQMPHATAQLDWELSQAISRRLLCSAPHVQFSFTKQVEGAEQRPSRVVQMLAGMPQPSPGDLARPLIARPLTVPVEDFSQIPFQPGKVRGGSAVLTNQSQCPFKAFATARLGAENWEPAEAGLNASQRGQLLHAVLHSVWAGPPEGIRSHADLLALNDRRAFVSGHVQQAFKAALPAGVYERMATRYLESEKRRLTRLVEGWLAYEAGRVPFEVVETEAAKPLSLDGLSFDIRLDRLDRLVDSSLLVIDYKSGDVSAKSWELPRPDDVQLPLYSGFGLDEGQELGGLVFAKLRPGEFCFDGRVGNAAATLRADLNKRSGLGHQPLHRGDAA
jgi:ATP-dependent helicase/nuclease subunit B